MDPTSQYRKLILSFYEPVELDNTHIRYYIETAPTDAEKKKFEDDTYTTRQYCYGDTRIDHVISPIRPASDELVQQIIILMMVMDGHIHL